MNYFLYVILNKVQKAYDSRMTHYKIEFEIQFLNVFLSIVKNIFYVLPDQPTFLKLPTNVEADNDETVYLFCEVDANPPSEIIWVFDPIDRVRQYISLSLS